MRKQMKCPVCGKRLFDVEENASGKLIIKCSCCKKIILINLTRFAAEKVEEILSFNTSTIRCICNQRLFDINGTGKGFIELKCMRCKKIEILNLETKKVILKSQSQIGA